MIKNNESECTKTHSINTVFSCLITYLFSDLFFAIPLLICASLFCIVITYIGWLMLGDIINKAVGGDIINMLILIILGIYLLAKLYTCLKKRQMELH